MSEEHNEYQAVVEEQSCSNDKKSQFSEQPQLLPQLVIVGDSSYQNSDTTLQNSFLKFRELKIRERQIIKWSQQYQSSGFEDCSSRTLEYKARLREKFIATAMKYIGVPYGVKYKEDHEEIAPLYLDCCGLVRRAVLDLKEDFGFIIGKWNQAYQMDTLPVGLSFEELKPGDLIFYEGSFFSSRHKVQKHNNVHVEIFLGGETGEATIGSRFHRGKVSIFPSYKFQSTTWELTQYHFRSLETWLDGVCKSHCEEHPWKSEISYSEEASGKRSIFNESDDESAGDDPFEAIDNDASTSATEVIESSQPTEITVETNSNSNPIVTEGTETIASGKDQTNRKDSTVASKPIRPRRRSMVASSNESSSDKVKADPTNSSALQKSFSCNEDDLIQKIEEVNRNRREDGKPRELQQQERGSGSHLTKSLDSVDGLKSNRSKPSSVQKGAVSSSGSPSVKRLKEHSVVKRPSMHDETSLSVAGVGSTVRSTAPTTNSSSSTTKKGVAADSSTHHTVDHHLASSSGPFTYFVSKSNGWMLVKDALDRRGWTQLLFESNLSNKFHLKWVEGRSQIDYKAHTAGQLVCHIQNNDVITTKIGLLTTLRDKFCRPQRAVPTNGSQSTAHPKSNGQRTPSPSKAKGGGNEASYSVQMLAHPPWLPETYDLASPADCIALLKENEILSNEKKNRMNGKENQEGQEGQEAVDQQLWIYKPSNNNRGRGIRLVFGQEALREICYGSIPSGPSSSSSMSHPPRGSETMPGDNSSSTVAPLKGIVQRYIEDPLLLGPNRNKFDIRVYLLIGRTYPKTVAFYHTGYCRLTLKSYSLHVDTIQDTSVHLTNAAIQKKDPNYSDNKEAQIQTIESVAAILERDGNQDSADYLRHKLDHEIKCCMVDVMRAGNHKLMKRSGYFDLLGCDFMLSLSNRLHLLEINTNPALSLDNSTLEVLLPRVVDGALEIVLSLQGPGRTSDCLVTPSMELPSEYELIFDESSGFEYR